MQILQISHIFKLQEFLADHNEMCHQYQEMTKEVLLPLQLKLWYWKSGLILDQRVSRFVALNHYTRNQCHLFKSEILRHWTNGNFTLHVFKIPYQRDPTTYKICIPSISIFRCNGLSMCDFHESSTLWLEVFSYQNYVIEIKSMGLLATLCTISLNSLGLFTILTSINF